jgi:transcription elongation factor Elf1
MRVCNRCGDKNVTVKYFEQVNGTEIDLCKKCEESFQAFLVSHEEPKRPAGRPPKEK